MKKTIIWVVILIILVAGLSYAVKDVARYREGQSDTQGNAQENNSGQIQTTLNQEGEARNVKITPVTLLEDSRCPADVQCIQAGTVRVQATVKTPVENSTETFQLNQPVTVGADRITLVAVRPVKESRVPINQEDYVFYFDVQ